MHRTTRFILFVLLAVLLPGCESDDSNNKSGSSGALGSHDTFTVENLFGSKVALELWSGDDLDFVSEDREVSGFDIERTHFLELEPNTSNSFSGEDGMTADVVAIAGVDNNGRYEYLTHEELAVFDGTTIRIDTDGTLEAYGAAGCLDGLSSADIDETTAATGLITSQAVLVANQGPVLRPLVAPLEVLADALRAIVEGNPAALPTESLVDWTYDAGVFTRTTNTGTALLTAEGRFLWGDSAPGETAGTTMAGRIDSADSYFTALSVAADGTDLVFTFANAGPLAPVFGIEAGATSPQRVDAADWLEGITRQLDTMDWRVDLTLAYQDGSQSILDVQLVHLGAPGYRLDFDPVTQTLTIERSETRLNLAAASDCTNCYFGPRAQQLAISEWTLEVAGDGTGSGTLSFAAAGDTRFDYEGRISYDQTDATAFLRCTSDGSPIPY